MNYQDSNFRHLSGWCIAVASILGGILLLQALGQTQASAMPRAEAATAVEERANLEEGAGVNGATPPTPPTPMAPKPAKPAMAPVPPQAPLSKSGKAVGPLLGTQAEGSLASGRVTPMATPLMAPVAPKLPAPRKEVGYWYKNGGDGTSWVLLYGDDAATMNGSMDNLKAARRLRASSKEEILWFRHGGQEYVLRDLATLKQAKELFRTEAALRARQGDLGRQQSVLGARQAELGTRQAALGSELSSAAALRTRRGGDADSRDLDEREEQIDAQIRVIEHRQEDLAKQQSVVEKQQEALGQDQEAESRRVEKELRSLMDSAIQGGLAQKIRE